MIKLVDENANIEEINLENISKNTLTDLVMIKNIITDNYAKITLAESEFRQTTEHQNKILHEKIDPLLLAIDNLENDYKKMFDEICNNAKFEEDKFLQSVKIKGDSYKEGRYRIIRHIKTERKLNQAEFKKKYPEEFMKIAEVGLTKADAEIGKNRVNQICAINEKYSFEFYNPDEHKEE